MKLGYTIIYVESVTDILTFYKSAFNLKTRFCTLLNKYSELALDSNTTLIFAYNQFVVANLGKNVFRKNRTDTGDSAEAEISFVVNEAVGETVKGRIEQVLAAGVSLVKSLETKL